LGDKGFPKIRWGTCPVCGANGADQSSGLSDADAAARDSTGNGVRLEEWRGKLYCEICLKEAKADEESVLSAKKHKDEERFRAGAGFVNDVASS